jgi:hypothetical protein
VVRSVSRLSLAALGLTVLTGCTTTQQKAARIQLNNARIRANLTALRLTGTSSTVRVTSIGVLTGRPSRDVAVVVALRNRSPRPVSDLPLLVGVKLPDGHRMDLNAAANLPYFRNHIPAIAPRGELTWVLTLTHRLPGRATPFARVGSSSPATLTTIGALPKLRVATSQPIGGEVAVTVQNLSGVTQYQLPVYAVAIRGKRFLAAGQTLVEELDGGAIAHLRLPLVGSPSGAKLSFEAPPTIFK